MQRLYEAKDPIEAQFLRDVLADAGIDAQVFGNFLSGAAGELPADIRPSVWVLKDHQLPTASRLLADFLDAPPARSTENWACPKCGEDSPDSFDFCWHCGASRPPHDSRL